MFGKNEIVGRKYFDEAGDKLFVTSIFMTLQGEGPLSGWPSVFVRLAKCNLNCSFCDTFFDDGDWLTIAEIQAKIEASIDDAFRSKGIDRPAYTQSNPKKQMALIITGGEPMLQANLVPFTDWGATEFSKVQIESNGTQYQPIGDDVVLVCSPKCVEKKGVAIKYLAPNQKVLERADCLKFVMSADEETPYHTIPDWALEWKTATGRPIFVSPMNIYNDIPAKSKHLRNTTNQIELETRSKVDEVISFWEPGLLNMEENQKNHEYTAQYALQHGLRLSLQQHLYASLA